MAGQPPTGARDPDEEAEIAAKVEELQGMSRKEIVSYAEGVLARRSGVDRRRTNLGRDPERRSGLDRRSGPQKNR